MGIVGGGFTGLAAAYELTKHNHEVVLFEKDNVLGGLAHGFKNSDYRSTNNENIGRTTRGSARRNGEWAWSLEFAYHHLFTNDYSILSLIHDLGMDDAIIVKRPVTATYFNGRISQLDSPLSLLNFRELSIVDRLRTGAVMAVCKLFPIWKPLEKYTAVQNFRTLFGNRSWSVIWEPLLYGKFGDLAPDVAASWLWARIHKRTTNLIYIHGGFQTIVNRLEEIIKKQGGNIHTGISVRSVFSKKTKISITWNDKTETFDKVLLTTPSPVSTKLVPDLPQSFITPLNTIPHLHAQLLILETDKPILKDIYWLNINDRTYPFLAAVAHTNLIDPKYYGGHHLTYFGNYLPQNHKYLSYSKEKLLKTFVPYIKRLSALLNTQYSILNTYLFTGPFAQPVHEVNYSQKAPPLETPISNVFLANMDSIYPWDRGTNYAVDLGIRAAKTIMK